MKRVGNDAGEARRIEHTLLEIELPRAILLCQEAALKPVCETADGDMQRRELLVEETTQPFKLFGVAQILGTDELIELTRENLISKGLRRVEHGMVGPARRRLRLARAIILGRLVIFLGNFRRIRLVLP